MLMARFCNIYNSMNFIKDRFVYKSNKYIIMASYAICKATSFMSAIDLLVRQWMWLLPLNSEITWNLVGILTVWFGNFYKYLKCYIY